MSGYRLVSLSGPCATNRQNAFTQNQFFMFMTSNLRVKSPKICLNIVSKHFSHYNLNVHYFFFESRIQSQITIKCKTDSPTLNNVILYNFYDR